jgi:hypothetical protein
MVPPSYGAIKLSKNGISGMSFNMALSKKQYKNKKLVKNQDVGIWNGDENSPVNYKNGQYLAKLAATNVYKVVVVLVSPFRN